MHPRCTLDWSQSKIFPVVDDIVTKIIDCNISDAIFVICVYLF